MRGPKRRRCRFWTVYTGHPAKKIYCTMLLRRNHLQKLNFVIYLQGKGLGSGHKTLLYGNAILLRHSNSDMVNMLHGRL
jgi:hypothetical protein